MKFTIDVLGVFLKVVVRVSGLFTIIKIHNGSCPISLLRFYPLNQSSSGF